MNMKKQTNETRNNFSNCCASDEQRIDELFLKRDYGTSSQEEVRGMLEEDVEEGIFSPVNNTRHGRSEIIPIRMFVHGRAG